MSGDNAVVIALACRNLPQKQRRSGIFWGVVGAVVLRIILTFFAVQLLKLPYLQLVGGVLLVWIGIKLIAEEDGDEHDVKASDRLIAAVQDGHRRRPRDEPRQRDRRGGAAKGSLPLLVFGLVVSIPLVVVGAPAHHEADRALPDRWSSPAAGCSASSPARCDRTIRR